MVADNDVLQSAKPVVEESAAASGIPIRYWVEPRQNIALARNKGIQNATGNFVAFIDEDEFPASRWLLIWYLLLAMFAMGNLSKLRSDCRRDSSSLGSLSNQQETSAFGA